MFISQVSFAQMPDPPQPNGNIINNSLNKFVGTWRWTSGTDTVTIILKKENILLPFPENSHADLIIGFHIYKKGNNIIENSIIFSKTNFIDKHSTILGGNEKGNDTLSCNLKDISKNKLVELTLILNNSQTQLQWNLQNTEGVKIGNYVSAITLPKSITLIKQ